MGDKEMDRKLLMIINPVSGNIQDKAETIAQIQQSLEAAGYKLRVWETTGENDLEKVKALIEEGQVVGVLVGGGDGTIKMVAEAILEYDRRIGIIPLGSANGLATSLEITDVEGAVEAVIAGEEVEMDTLMINGELCLHISDFGFNASLIKRFEEGDERGMLAYTKSTLTQLFDVKPYSFEIDMAGKTERVEAKMLAIANGNKYGTGAVLNPVGKIRDGLFEIVAINPEKAEDFVKVSMALFWGDVGELETVRIWSTNKAVIRNLDGADFQIDGELLGKVKEVTVEVDRSPIRFYKGKG